MYIQTITNSFLLQSSVSLTSSNGSYLIILLVNCRKAWRYTLRYYDDIGVTGQGNTSYQVFPGKDETCYIVVLGHVLEVPLFSISEDQEFMN